MSRKIRVAVLFGGRSAEHEVSITSARSMLQAIDRGKYDVTMIPITKDGRWLPAAEAPQVLEAGVAEGGETLPVLFDYRAGTQLASAGVSGSYRCRDRRCLSSASRTVWRRRHCAGPSRAGGYCLCRVGRAGISRGHGQGDDETGDARRGIADRRIHCSAEEPLARPARACAVGAGGSIHLSRLRQAR